MGQTTLDSQVTEIIGRNWLVNELLRAGVEVAAPYRDRGIDLIAYLDLEETGQLDRKTPPRFAARPLQLKAVNGARFSVDTKYAKFSDLLLVHVWYLEDPARTVAYAHSYPEALAVATTMGWTETGSWRKFGMYSMATPSQALRDVLEPNRMSRHHWRQLVLGSV